MQDTKKYTFDELSKMAQEKPAVFESMRRQAIEDLIQRTPEARQQRLRRLQWRIEQERRMAQTPIAACIRLSRMMWESLLGDGGLLDRLEHFGRFIGPQPETAGVMPQAKVIPLRREV